MTLLATSVARAVHPELHIQELIARATPRAYVLDPAGRIRFTGAPTWNDLLVQITAVREERFTPR